MAGKNLSFRQVNIDDEFACQRGNTWTLGELPLSGTTVPTSDQHGNAIPLCAGVNSSCRKKMGTPPCISRLLESAVLVSALRLDNAFACLHAIASRLDAIAIRCRIVSLDSIIAKGQWSAQTTVESISTK